MVWHWPFCMPVPIKHQSSFLPGRIISKAECSSVKKHEHSDQKFLVPSQISDHRDWSFSLWVFACWYWWIEFFFFFCCLDSEDGYQFPTLLILPVNIFLYVQLCPLLEEGVSQDPQQMHAAMTRTKPLTLFFSCGISHPVPSTKLKSVHILCLGPCFTSLLSCFRAIIK